MIVQHPETVGHGPQLFQTFTVHRSPVTKVMLSEKHLVSGWYIVKDYFFRGNSESFAHFSAKNFIVISKGFCKTFLLKSHNS